MFCGYFVWDDKASVMMFCPSDGSYEELVVCNHVGESVGSEERVLETFFTVDNPIWLSGMKIGNRLLLARAKPFRVYEKMGNLVIDFRGIERASRYSGYDGYCQ